MCRQEFKQDINTGIRELPILDQNTIDGECWVFLLFFGEVHHQVNEDFVIDD